MDDPTRFEQHCRMHCVFITMVHGRRTDGSALRPLPLVRGAVHHLPRFTASAVECGHGIHRTRCTVDSMSLSVDVLQARQGANLSAITLLLVRKPTNSVHSSGSKSYLVSVAQVYQKPPRQHLSFMGTHKVPRRRVNAPIVDTD